MPMFKKSGGKIFAVQFNKAEERALDQEIKKQIVENDRAFDMDKESSICGCFIPNLDLAPSA